MPKIFRFLCVLLLSLSALALQAGDPLNYFVYPYVEVDGKKWENISSQFSFADAGTSNMVATRARPAFVRECYSTL